jgi:hypothetical protein
MLAGAKLFAGVTASNVRLNFNDLFGIVISVLISSRFEGLGSLALVLSSLGSSHLGVYLHFSFLRLPCA